MEVRVNGSELKVLKSLRAQALAAEKALSQLTHRLEGAVLLALSEVEQSPINYDLSRLDEGIILVPDFRPDEKVTSKKSNG